MTNPAEWPPSPNGGKSSTADLAKNEASGVKDTAVDAGKNVATTAKDEVTNVAAETRQQARSLLSSVTSEIGDQAGSQQQKLAAALHSLSEELSGMASGSQTSGPLTDLAQQASRKGGEIAHWLENREPRDVLTEVSAFARRRPVTFLALCGLAGVVAGRLTRGAVAANTSIDSPEVESATPRALTAQPVTVQPVTAQPGAQHRPERDRESISMVDEAPTAYEDRVGSSVGYGAPVFDDARDESNVMR